MAAKVNGNTARQGTSLQESKAFSVRAYCMLLAVAAILLYANTLWNGYAFDDRMVIQENVIVKKGFAGIPELLTTTHLRGFIRLPNDKYRPMSLVMFAAEYGMAGANPMVGHLVNILLFAGCVVLTFLFLRNIFGAEKTMVAFAAAMLFAVHPVHTEIVANIKSRDELLSYLLGLLSLMQFVGYARQGGTGRLWGGALLYLPALMSKENVIMFLGIVPLLFLFYVNDEKKRSIHIISAVAVTAAVFIGLAYTVIRINGTGLPHEASDFSLNALIAAPDAATRYATAIYALGIYLKLLFVPYPLLCNYSYSSIPFVGFGNVWVLITIAVYGTLIAAGMYRLRKKKRDPLAFAILFYLLVMALFSNLFAMLGSQVAERFLFLPSMGFCLAIAMGMEWIVYRGKKADEIQAGNKMLLLLIPVLVLFAPLTIARNADWKDNATLFSADVANSPDDCRLNFFMAGVAAPPAGATDPQAYKEQIQYLQRALSIYPDFIQAHTSLAQVYAAVGQYDSAYLHGIAALRERPDNSIATYTTGTAAYALKQYKEAAHWLRATTALAPEYTLAHLNLAGCYADMGAYDSAIVYYNKALGLDSNSLTARRGTAIAYMQTGNYDAAAYHMRLAIAHGGDAGDLNNLGAIYLSAKKYREAVDVFKKVAETAAMAATAYGNLAIVYEQMGMKDSAAIYRGMYAHK